MRITLKAEKPGPAYRVHLNGKPSPLFVAFDRPMKEWDLCTEQEHIMSAGSRPQPNSSSTSLVAGSRTCGSWSTTWKPT